MQALGSRRGGLVTLVIAAAAIVVAATFLIFQFADRPQVAGLNPAPDSAVNTADPVITFSIDGERRLSDLRVTLDGRDVTGAAQADGDNVMVPVEGLADGAHEVEISFSSHNVFARSVDRRWSFEIDTVPPPLSVSAPAPNSLINRRAVRFTGTSEPGALVSVAHEEGRKTTTAGPKGGWTMVARLPEGRNLVTVTAADRAGNTTERRRRVGIDTVPPNVLVSAPGDEPLTLTDEPLIYGQVKPGDNPRSLHYRVVVNGTETLSVAGTAAPVAADAPSEGLTEAGAGEQDALQIDGRRFALAPGALAQGRNRVVLSVTDPAGNTTTVSRRVMVNSSDTFGEYDLVVGASGEDVTQLQQRLREAGVFPKKAAINGRYDKTTVQSVRRYQRSRALPVNGQVDERMRQAMLGRLVVNLGSRRLSLIRDGKVVRTYPIAIGKPGHATPTGSYEIIQKQVDPTWFPPDSPWAAGLGPIPPGAGNPLGTRWIGTSAPAIGIHGTYADSSIGTAASHGCMRMHIPDVEELYDQVSLGMKVIIRP